MVGGAKWRLASKNQAKSHNVIDHDIGQANPRRQFLGTFLVPDDI